MKRCARHIGKKLKGCPGCAMEHRDFYARENDLLWRCLDEIEMNCDGPQRKAINIRDADALAKSLGVEAEGKGRER